MDIGKELRVIEVEEPDIQHIEEVKPETVEITDEQLDAEPKTGKTG